MVLGVLASEKPRGQWGMGVMDREYVFLDSGKIVIALLIFRLLFLTMGVYMYCLNNNIFVKRTM